MPLPAGTGLTRRKFVAKSLGLALSVYGAGKLQFFDEGIANAPRRPELADPGQRLPAGRRRLALAPLPAGRPALREVPHRPRGHRRHTVHRGSDALLEPGARAARAVARRGQGDRAAGDRLRPSRPVALHLPPLLGGRRHRSASADGLARPLPRHRRRGGQPAAGPLDHRQPRAVAGDGARSRSPRSTAPNQYSFGAQGVWGTVQNRHARRDGRARQRALARPGVRDRGQRDEAVRPPAPPAAPVRGQSGSRRPSLPDGERHASRPASRASPR